MAGAASSLFGYNRQNFMFDKGQQQERVYFGQEMRVKRYELYREDIRDLTDLTVSKMDLYLIVNTLQLLFCAELFTEGVPQPGKSPFWLLWLFAASCAGAVMYFVLSIWLGMHASVAAHSFGVRMLTQFVRLPVPSTRQIHAASAKAQDFESAGISALFRIPVLQQQLRRMNVALGQPSSALGDGVFDSQAPEEGQGAENGPPSGLRLPGHFLPEVERERAEMQAHIQLYRQLQANWQAYDAYSRVCMAMGTNQLLQAMCHYCLGVLLQETNTGWAGFVCMVLLGDQAWLLTRLDVLISPSMLYLCRAMQQLPPLLALLCLTAHRTRSWKATAESVVPFIFVLYTLWIACIIYLAKAENIDVVALPSKFRSVMYLDVFGWYSSRDEAVDQDQPDIERQPSVDSGEAAPVALHISLCELCLRRKAEFELELAKWEHENLESMTEDPLIGREVVNRRSMFNLVAADLRDLTQSKFLAEVRPAEATTNGSVWLKLEWNPSGIATEYFYDPDSGQTLWTHPSAPDRVSDLIELKDELEIFQEKVQALRVLLRQLELQEQQNAPEIEEPEQQDLSLQADETFSQSSSSRLNSRDATRSFPPGSSNRQEARTGIGAEGLATRLFGNPGEAAAEFHPHRPDDGSEDSEPSARRLPPGHLPWTTFSQGSYLLMWIWVLGTFWVTLRLRFGFRVPIRPAPVKPGSLASWDRSDLEMVFDGWPHPHFSPKGLACHESLGERFFVAEAHAVHELRGSSSSSGLELQPALEDCLHEATDFLAEGIKDITIECRGRHKAIDSDCNVVLLGARGRSILRCPLQGDSSTSNSKSQETVTRLFGGPWVALAAMAVGSSGNTPFLALKSEVPSLAQLDLESGHEDLLIPTLEVSAPGLADAQTWSHTLRRLHVSGDRSRVLVLEPEGGLHVHIVLSPQSAQSYLLPPEEGSRWAGLCSTRAGELMVVSTPINSAIALGGPAIWRTHLAELNEID